MFQFQIKNRLSVRILDKIVCPQCKAQILLIPDLKKMAAVIADHLEIHTNKLKAKKIPESEIARQEKELEHTLIKEIIDVI